MRKVLMAWGAVALMAACGAMRGGGQNTWPLAVSPDLPAARGVVTVRPGDAGNQRLEVNVEHLARPERAAGGATTYVVWLSPRAGGPPVNLGVLSVGDDLRGRFTGTTAFRDFDVFITAEPHAGVTMPTRREVMRASVRVPERAVR